MNKNKIVSFADAAKALNKKKDDALADIEFTRSFVKSYCKMLRDGKGTKYLYDETLAKPSIMAINIVSAIILDSQELDIDKPQDALIIVSTKKGNIPPSKLGDYQVVQVFEFEKALDRIYNQLVA